MYRGLLALLQREALLALCVRALEIVCDEPRAQGRSKPRPMPRREAALFRKKFLASLVRQQGWAIGEALDFQRDLQTFEELIARVGPSRRSRKPFEAANHPFVDRCAFLLDSSFLEQARMAASKTLMNIEELAEQIVHPADSKENNIGMLGNGKPTCLGSTIVSVRFRPSRLKCHLNANGSRGLVAHTRLITESR